MVKIEEWSEEAKAFWTIMLCLVIVPGVVGAAALICDATVH